MSSRQLNAIDYWYGFSPSVSIPHSYVEPPTMFPVATYLTSAPSEEGNTPSLPLAAQPCSEEGRCRFCSEALPSLVETLSPDHLRSSVRDQPTYIAVRYGDRVSERLAHGASRC